MVKTETSINRFILFLFFLQPVFFNPRGDDVFHLAKNTYFCALLTLLFLVWLVRRFESEDKFCFLKSTFPAPLLFFVLSALLSYILSIHKQTSQNELILTLSYFLWFLFFIHLLTKEEGMQTILYVLSFSVFFASMYGLFQRFGIDFVHWSDPSVRFRPSSTQGNPDFFGAFLAVSFPYVLYLVLKMFEGITSPLRSKPAMLLFLFLTLWLSFLAMLFTFARASWIAWLGALFIFLLFTPKETYRKTWHVFLFMFLVLGATVLIVNQHKIPIIGAQGAVGIGGRLGVGSSGQIRLILWGDTLHLIRRAPFYGYGLSTYSLVYPRHRSVDILKIQAITALPEDAHNEFLQRATTTGFLGFFCYAWLVAYIYLKMLKLRQCKPLLSAVLLSSFTAYHIQSFFNPRVPDLALLFWMTCGLVISAGETEHSPTTRPFSMLLTSASKNLRIIFSLSLCLLIAVFTLPKIMWPVVADTQFHQGILLFQAGRFEKASFHYAYAVEADKNCLKCARELALCYKRVGELTGSGQIMQTAAKEYEKLLPRMPYDGSLYADAGRAYLVLASKQKKYYKQAIKHLKHAVALDPNYPIFYNDLGIAYLHSGNNVDAEKALKNASKLVPDFFDPYLNLGVLYYRMKKLPLAIKNAQKALKLDPQSAEAHANLAVFYNESGGREKDAVNEAELAVKYSQGNKRYLPLLDKMKGKKVKK